MRWIQAGGDIFKLSKILGHASVAVTEERYAHLLKDDRVAASRQVKLPTATRTGNNDRRDSHAEPTSLKGARDRAVVYTTGIYQGA
jgi:hypothetical protein